MKCGALLYKELRGKKRPKLKTLYIVSRQHIKDGFKLPHPREKWEECDGEIKSSIHIESSCNCGCNGYIRIEYECKKCGNCYFPELTYGNDVDFAEKLIDSAILALPEE